MKEIKDLYRAIASVFVNSQQGHGEDDHFKDEESRCRAKKRACTDAQGDFITGADALRNECEELAFINNIETMDEDGSYEAAICGYAMDMCACEVEWRVSFCEYLKEIEECYNRESAEFGAPCLGKIGMRVHDGDCNNVHIPDRGGNCQLACNWCPSEYNDTSNPYTHDTLGIYPCKNGSNICMSHMYKIKLWIDAINRLDENVCYGIADPCSLCDCKQLLAIRLWKLRRQFCSYVKGIEGIDGCQAFLIEKGIDYCGDYQHWYLDFDFEGCKQDADCGEGDVGFDGDGDDLTVVLGPKTIKPDPSPMKS